MADFIALDCWEDEEPARRYDEWEQAWAAIEEEQEPPEECPCCRSETPGACSVCSMLPARPEGGERDG